MRQVGIYEAKTQLAKLVDEVATGQTVTITRHGKPVAMLVPVARDSASDVKAEMSVSEAIEAIRAFGKAHRGGKPTLKEIIDEARQH